MEYVEGAGLIFLGLIVIIFGSAKTPSGSAGTRARFKLPAVIDTAMTWAIGLVCIWFGAALFLGHSHFF